MNGCKKPLQDVRPPGNIKVREDACERPEEGCIHNECAGHVQSEGIFANLKHDMFCYELKIGAELFQITILISRKD